MKQKRGLVITHIWYYCDDGFEKMMMMMRMMMMMMAVTLYSFNRLRTYNIITDGSSIRSSHVSGGWGTFILIFEILPSRI
jgi:hypothetical protein